MNKFRLLAQIGVGLPILLLAAAIVIDPSLNKQSSLECAPFGNEGYTDGLYNQNYCWERLQTLGTTNTTSDGHYQYHKMFPYLLFGLALVVFIPHCLFTLVYQEKIRTHCVFMMSALEEGIFEMFSAIKTLLNEDGGKNDLKVTRAKIREGFEKSAKSWEIDKFEMFEKYVKVERGSVVLTTGLALRRLLTLAALALDGIIFDQVFCPIINNTHEDERGHYCTVSDIGTRLFICRVYISCIFVSLLAGSCSFFKDLSEINKAKDILELCPLIDENILSKETCSNGICGINDLSILLLLVRENFADTKAMKFCLDAKKLADETKADYLNVLVTKIAWKLNDSLDEAYKETNITGD
ncbi:unnamed protein product [Oikopleura dioica]|uniref:Innexin n=1 Tax=Oikopleura dioica TaxID=34765 RepID=E4YJ33_OIKDI|nr:unnamed protein product [Oikopleura dioica]